MAQFPPPTHNAFDMEGLLTPEELDIRDRTRAFMVSVLYSHTQLKKTARPPK